MSKSSSLDAFIIPTLMSSTQTKMFDNNKRVDGNMAEPLAMFDNNKLLDGNVPERVTFMFYSSDEASKILPHADKIDCCHIRGNIRLNQVANSEETKKSY
jgi:hypothetical protein